MYNILQIKDCKSDNFIELILYDAYIKRVGWISSSYAF